MPSAQARRGAPPVHSNVMKSIACFISPHGFGHAARTCAVLNALGRARPVFRFHLFTTVPEWFFAESLQSCFVFHHCRADVGLIQKSPFDEDLESTVRALDLAPWRDAAVVEQLADQLQKLECCLVIADISPLGLSVARRAGLPSVLVENFTWDWIYSRIEGPEELHGYGDEMTPIFATADLRIQTKPACDRVSAAVRVGPVSRPPRHSREEVRRRLGIPRSDPMVLASMGGLGWDYPRLEERLGRRGPWVVVPGGADTETRRDRLLLLPFQSSHFHPDLVNAADVVVGKLGYSTVAEVWRAATALVYVERPRFPESPVLARFVDRHLASVALDRRAFETGAWEGAVHEVLGAARPVPRGADGATEAVTAISRRFPEIFG